MQDFAGLNSEDSLAVISSMAEGSVYTFKDSRDQQSYSIAKLKDGKVWMLDNLALGGDNEIRLTSDNTNIESNTVTKSGTGYFTLPASGTANFTSSTGYTTAAINASKKDTVAGGSAGYADGKIGVYYNYCAASAGTYCYENNNTGDNNHENVNASYDICPKGWRMPTGGSGGEYQTLYTAYGGSGTSYSADFVNALRTPLSGYFYNGSGGGFWSSTYGSSTDMYTLSLNSSSVYPTDYNYRYYGFSVRCVLK